MKHLKWWRTRRTYVKPVSNSPLFNDQWLSLNLTPLEDFRDDWRRYGLRIALKNLLIQVFDLAPSSEVDE